MCPKECCAKWEFGGQLFFVGARDFSPSSLEFSGLKVPCSEGFESPQIAIFSATMMLANRGALHSPPGIRGDI